MAAVQKKGRAWEKVEQNVAEYSNAYPELAMMFTDAISGKMKFDINDVTAKFKAGSSMATRSIRCCTGGFDAEAAVCNRWFSGSDASE